LPACAAWEPDKPAEVGAELTTQQTGVPGISEPPAGRRAAGAQRPGAVPAADHLQYFDLSEQQKELYDQLTAGLTALELVIVVDSYWGQEEAEAAGTVVYELVERNNPELFWIPKHRVQGTDASGEYSIRPVYTIDGAEFAVVMDDTGHYTYPSAEQTAAAEAWVQRGQAAINNVVSQLPINAGMTPFELELAVHDWLVQHIAYDLDAPNKHSLYGALVEGRATCEGYAKSFQFIMRLLGVECVRYTGRLISNADVGHTWNALKLDGQWYQIDVTSDATAGASIDQPHFHAYFNRTDQVMALTHTLDDVGYNPLVSCTATEYDYYRHTGRLITADADFTDQVPGIMARARAEGQPTFELEFAPDYARPADIGEKKQLLDRSLWQDVTFSYMTDGTLVFGQLD